MFHQAIRKRHLHNKVLQIDNSRGMQFNDPEDILQAFVDYYKELLGSNSQTRDFYKHIVAQGELVETSDWDRMCRIPSEEDVRKVLFSIPNDKSPGPDGYTSYFFKASWSILKTDAYAILKDFFEQGKLLKIVSQMQGFQFHPLYKSLKLTHLMFADDLLIFCKGDVRTVFIVMEAFKRFSNASGLNINSKKSDFYCNWMSPALVQKVLHGTGFKRGDLPFRYLGVKILHKRLTNTDCNILVDRMINRIRGWNSKKISYSGRLVLVMSVMATIHNHWAQIFVLPVGVMDRIQALCRNFLWEGEDKYSKAPLVAWNVLCQGKEYEGLRIIDSKLWNVAAIGKLVWWLARKQDHLWIKWVNNIYIKGVNWLQYEPTNFSSWAWRKICEVKNILQVPAVKVTWYKVAWNRYNMPKWNFIMWLRQHQRLLTLDKMRKMGLDVPSIYYICGLEPEDHDHQFQHCCFAKTCYQLLADWLHVSTYVLCSCDSLLKFRRSMFIRQICMAAVMGVSYGIWRSRNWCRLEGYVIRPVKLITQAQNECKRQVSGLFQGCRNRDDKEWCSKSSLI
ncbi:uncharacterized protein LOC141628638 [Silene latifolia]|uniref:uncharacterized protein LOC141628638 n=1 Tax=Silene latifolia TaxID=37657 RepID=UPI003D76BB94